MHKLCLYEYTTLRTFPTKNLSLYIISVLYTAFFDTVEEENPKVLRITSLDQSLKVCNKK